jgi:hypothetical protein
MDLLVPADRVVEPFFLCKAERLFDLRADVRFTETLVEEGYKNDRRDLLDEDAIYVRQLTALPRGHTRDSLPQLYLV